MESHEKRWNVLSQVAVYDDNDPILEMMDKVAVRLLKGKSELAIARDLGIKRVEVIRYAELWKEQLRNSDTAEAARDHLNMMVKHYDRLIEKSYEVYRNLEFMSFDEKVAAQMNTTLKNISEYESRRVDALQKAGLLEGAEMGDEIAAMEQKHEIIIKILREDLCPVCKPMVMSKLKAVTGKVEAHQVEDDPNIVDGEVVEDE